MFGMIKVLRDTLTNDGVWSQKKIQTFTSFYVAALYAFMPALMPTFQVNEVIFLGFLTAGGYAIYQTQKQKSAQ
jgi:hypothetical protein